ncbi:MAG: ABC transporter ATP-binding protein [Planctomycetota bacterium]|jgi:lipopolysaccharide transport system ATP-binding protein
MSSPAIIVDGIGKKYRIGLRAAQGQNFREMVGDAVLAPWRRLRRLGEGATAADTFWALRDISFEVQPGDVVGIIGRNGAGKSTLLKILSRITEPTEGTARIRGRVASLLEVGTGFHHELTGRENVYLNGAILGMRKTEIDRKFDEIVAFAEIEKFLDSPVKRYSSGMAVRLAFAVAAHLEPEILIVDEVLAVGDAAFQQRCLGKMKEVASGEGRTVLFVSHNMPAIRSLCRTGILLDGGRIVLHDDADTVATGYLRRLTGSDLAAAITLDRPRGARHWMTSARLVVDGSEAGDVYMGSELVLEVEFGAESPLHHPRIGFIIHGEDGGRLINTNNRFQPSPDPEPPLRRGLIRCHLGALPLVGGRYSLSLFFGDAVGDSHVVEHALTFEVHERDIWGGGRIPPRHDSALWWPTTFEVRSLDNAPVA